MVDAIEAKHTDITAEADNTDVERDGGCGRQLIRTRRKNKGPRWRRRNAAETAPASAHVPRSKTEAELAAASPSKRKREDDNAANGFPRLWDVLIAHTCTYKSLMKRRLHRAKRYTHNQFTGCL
ncbi:hypothetical protein DPMN_007182 [Dreissena polymorpha]|uniref:Uncharacterized protein n=1 Tax=Dreissena polymorpha TaxID=45954 RepID=A0A9D4RY60_DREPO|nr:hypothetical protein DPMN_007182 [Dreissena polymorpha]